MARKEEILNKAIEFVDKSYTNVGIKTTHEASVAACQEIAEWADSTMLNKACEWLRRSTILADTTIERFKQAMEE